MTNLPRHRHVFPLVLAAGMGLLHVAATSIMGPDWDGDYVEDAGDLPDSSQKVVQDSTDFVMVARGQLKGEEEAEGLAGTTIGDYQDMYEVVITDPGLFSIKTLPPLGGAEFNSILTVFKQNGMPLLANDDADNGVTGSYVGNQASSGTFEITSPGVIYIAISGWPSRPVNDMGEDIFAWSNDPTEVVGPSNTPSPIAGWSGPGEIGTYEIQLTAVGPVPSACGAANTDSCFEVHALPFCSTPGCCEAVCAVDPFCCDVTWDAICVKEASFFCGGEGLLHCGSSEAGPCQAPNATPYCQDPACCANVCMIAPECCETAWDENCAYTAEKICQAPCNQACPADLDFDSLVTGSDLAILLGHWNQPGCTDINGDGTTNGADLTVILALWGEACSQ